MLLAILLAISLSSGTQVIASTDVEFHKCFLEPLDGSGALLHKNNLYVEDCVLSSVDGTPIMKTVFMNEYKYRFIVGSQIECEAHKIELEKFNEYYEENSMCDIERMYLEEGAVE